MAPASDDPSAPKQVIIKKLSFLETAQKIINKDGVAGLWAGIGPALTLVINPIIQVREWTLLISIVAHTDAFSPDV
jgi:hypothetical protein